MRVVVVASCGEVSLGKLFFISQGSADLTVVEM